VGGGVKVLHMVGNAHIDPVWLWRWPEGYQEVHATFASALDRLDEYPEFVFTSTSVVFLEWVAEHDPALLERIRARVAEGRWQVVGGWWLEPDCNIPAGESLGRQALYGQRWLHDRLGVLATTGANLDSFGHNAVLPQILARSGCDSYVFLRPGPHEKALPAPLFRWRAADGSSVAAYRIPHEYCSPGGDLGNQIDKALAQLPTDEPELMVFYGVGNHGGGPTRANLDSIRRLDAAGTLPRLVCSSPRAFFDAVGAQDGLPEVTGDLLHHSPGCYSAHSGIKRWNRRAENLLQRAEKWSVVAAALGGPAYPLAELTQAWKLLLVNQFHDTLAGTSIAPAYEDARDQLGHASSVAAWAFNRAVQSVARRIDIPLVEGTQPLVVFNPHAWRLRADVELEFAGFPGGERLVDDAGAEVPLQRTRSHATVGGPRGRIVFPADVPPLGYRVYRLLPGPGTYLAPGEFAPEPGPGTYQARAGTVPDVPQLENEHVLLELDAATGRIARLLCKATGASVAGASAPHAVVVDDRSDTWGHRVRAYDDVLGELEATSVRTVERGPVRTIVRVESRYGASTLREDYVLSTGARHVDVRVTLDWHERLKLLKLRYPTGLDAATATFQVPYGFAERAASGDEEPGQAWVDVSVGDAGLAVLNDGKHGFDVRRGDVGVTVVRSPAYAWHDPRELDPGGDVEWMDQGRQRFTLRLVPHAGDWREAGVVRLAAELNQPPFALLEAAHTGDLPASASYADDGGGAVVLAVVKRAEDGDGIVARAYETTGRAAHAAVRVLDHAFEARLAAHEIKTFHLGETVREVNLLEW
jgi:alpha-mannosidase